MKPHAHVLVLQQLPYYRRLLRDALRARGHTVAAAADEAEAAQALQERVPDYVIVDTGSIAPESWRRLQPRCPAAVVVLTARDFSAEPEVSEALRAYGARAIAGRDTETVLSAVDAPPETVLRTEKELKEFAERARRDEFEQLARSATVDQILERADFLELLYRRLDWTPRHRAPAAALQVFSFLQLLDTRQFPGLDTYVSDVFAERPLAVEALFKKLKWTEQAAAARELLQLFTDWEESDGSQASEVALQHRASQLDERLGRHRPISDLAGFRRFVHAHADDLRSAPSPQERLSPGETPLPPASTVPGGGILQALRRLFRRPL